MLAWEIRWRSGNARLVASHAGVRLAGETHGTMLSLLSARANRLDPLTLWRSLRMPDACLVGAVAFEIRARLPGRLPRAP